MWQYAHHASAWEDVPAQADSITVLNLTPLLLEGIVIHRVGCRRCGLGSEAISGIGVAGGLDSFAVVEGGGKTLLDYVQAVISIEPSLNQKVAAHGAPTLRKLAGPTRVLGACCVPTTLGSGIE